MNILLTSPRAPVTLEWLRLALDGGHRVWLCDSLRWPLGRFAGHSTVRYYRIPPPRLDFTGYRRAMLPLLEWADFVVPTCEDIFYLARMPLNENTRAKCFMPPPDLLLALHHKHRLFERVPLHPDVRFPATRLITRHSEIVPDTSGRKTVLKPVFSRFGRSVVRGVTAQNIAHLTISADYPWVQQQFIDGQGLCNYALCVHGEMVAHAAYRPRYPLNQAAATYFQPVQDERAQAFTRAFAAQHAYHGQVAFDFIDDGASLWLLECNPRATSGLHLLRPNLQLDGQGGLRFSGSLPPHSYRVGNTLPLLFGRQAWRNGQWHELWRDYRAAQDVLAGLPFYAPWLAFAEMLLRARRHRIPLTDAGTFDIEYNGTGDTT